MFRYSLICCVALIFGVTAKPFEPLNKFKEETFQDVVMSIDHTGDMSWGVQVEPPEDTDETEYNIDPRMKIWKSMMGKGQEEKTPEEDLDDLYHPSAEDFVISQLQKMAAFPATAQEDNMNNQEPGYEQDVSDRSFFSEVDEPAQEPEQDWDEVYHKDWEGLDGYLAPMMAERRAGTNGRTTHTEPEEDEDEMYHQDDQLLPAEIMPLRPEVRGESEVRIHLQPEEDMDDLYHKDVLLPDSYQHEAPADVPPQRKYSEPEVDLDDFYHQ